MTGPTQKIVEGGCYDPAGWYPHPGQPRRQPFRMSLWVYLALVVAVLTTLAMTGLAVANYHSREYRQCVANMKYDAQMLRGADPADLDEDAIGHSCELMVGPCPALWLRLDTLRLPLYARYLRWQIDRVWTHIEELS